MKGKSDIDIEGHLIKEKYLVSRFLDKGKFGKIYKVVNLENRAERLAIKVYP